MIFKDTKWVQGEKTCTAPIFRRAFYAEKLLSAKITICGLGFFELFLNGKKVSDDLLVPVWSNYEPRVNRAILYPINDEFSYRTYYLQYDILPYLREGNNILGVMLGNGWYNQTKRNIEGDFYYGFPKLCFIINMEDNNGNNHIIKSDEEVIWCESEIVENNLYFGECHDLRKKKEDWNKLECDENNWKNVNIVDAPNTSFVLQTCPTDKIIRKIQPILIFEDGNRKIYDCKENITGFVVVQSSKNNGEIIRIQHSEELNFEKNKLDFESTGGENQIQTAEYICSNISYLCYPKFSWYGFRYFEVLGLADIVEVAVVHSDVAITSHFECSNTTLNWLYNSYIRSQLTNIHCGVPSDCPHRERLGYTGDGQITAEAAMITLDTRLIYDKWMDDIADCQDIKTGHVQHTAPFYGGGGGPGGWGSAICFIPYTYYRYFGDKNFLIKYYSNMRLWLDYMEIHSENGLVTHEEKGGWCLGEWCTPNHPELPEPFVNTYYYIKSLDIVKYISSLLCKEDEATLISKRLEFCKNAVINAYYDEKTGSFCKGVNGADAFAIDMGIGNDKTLDSLMKKYSMTRTLDTGIFGTNILIDVLFRHNANELAFDLLTRFTEASFEKMRISGATTLWERWDGKESHNHPMFGSVVRLLFIHILGIKQYEGSVGFSDVTVNPVTITKLDWAKGYITTPKGKIYVSYEKDANGYLIVKNEIKISD